MSTYSDAVIAQTPVAYWRLGEPSGPVAIDEMFTYYAEYFNTPTLGVPGAIDGDSDTAITLTAANTEYFRHLAIPYGDVFTWMLWFKNGSGGGVQVIAAAGPSVAGNPRFYIAGNGLVMDATATVLATGAVHADAASWHHIAAVKNGATSVIYYDGQPDSTPGTNVTITPGTDAFHVGVTPAISLPFNGSLDEFAIFNRALTANEILNFYNIGSAPGATGLDAIAQALALRFAAAAMTPPAGYRPIRASTADLPNELPPLPCVLVFPDSGDFDTGNGTRLGTHDFFVRFYFAQTIDLTRDMNALRQWVSVLWYQLRDSAQLGGIVDRATVDGYQMGMLTYGGETYSGIELRVRIVKTEAWAAVA